MEKPPMLKFVYNKWGEKEFNFLIKKLKEKSSTGRPLTFMAIVGDAKKEGMEMSEKSIKGFTIKYGALLERQGVVLGKDRMSQTVRNRQWMGRDGRKK